MASLASNLPAITHDQAVNKTQHHKSDRAGGSARLDWRRERGRSLMKAR